MLQLFFKPWIFRKAGVDMSKKTSKSVSKKPEKTRERRLKAEDFDEIDEFAAQRERIGFEESDINSNEDYAAFDEEAILNVPDAEDFDNDFSESGEDSEDSKVTRRQSKKDKIAALREKSSQKGKKDKKRLNRLAAEADDSDDDILYDRLHREASDDEENAATVWGKNRKNYYAEDESADAVEEEAQEARRLQKKKLSSLKFDDFIDGEADFSRVSKSSAQKKTLQFDDLDELESSEDETVEDSDDQVVMEEEDMGEFLALLKDFKERLNLLRTQLQPLLQKAKESKMPTSSGLSFLQLKYHLMLGYCSSVVFYLMLKGRAGSVQGHPVIRKMLRYRLMLEKIRPLEIKMRFQIEKLLQPQHDETRFRPNPDSMAVDENNESASDDEEDDGKYRAPKLAPVFYPEDEKDAAKSKREEERRSRAASKSRLLAELRGELDDAPEEESIDPVRMASRVANDHRAAAREAYEEENFTRFQVSKKEKRRLETAAKPLDELDDLDEFFGELEEINETATGKNKKKTKKSESIAAYLDQINGSKDIEMPESSSNAKYQGSDESDIEDDLPRASRSDSKRQKRQEKLASRREANGPISYRPIADLPSSAPRPASYSMIKNKGLTPSRSKEQRNPRVKQRTRYEKAVKKLSSSRGGKLTTDTSKPYAGESTGIRTNLTKSVRFK
jgi:hypothetical protein